MEEYHLGHNLLYCTGGDIAKIKKKKETTQKHSDISKLILKAIQYEDIALEAEELT